MAPLVLKNIFRNGTEGLFGAVSVSVNASDPGGSDYADSDYLNLDADADADADADDIVVGNDTDVRNVMDCINGTTGHHVTATPSDGSSVFADIPAKELIIVGLMLLLWIYSIALTRKAWYRLLKE